MAREAAMPGGSMRGSAPPAKTGGQRLPSGSSAPAMEPAFQTSPGRSTNKRVIAEPAFKTRGGKGNGS